jgi:hypothetical protein
MRQRAKKSKPLLEKFGDEMRLALEWVRSLLLNAACLEDDDARGSVGAKKWRCNCAGARWHCSRHVEIVIVVILNLVVGISVIRGRRRGRIGYSAKLRPRLHLDH